MNTGSVITNHETKMKVGHVFANPAVFPKFAVLNPEFTFSLPKYQMVAGIFDIMNHITEQYFSGEDDNTSDYLAEGLMCNLVRASRIAVESPEDYEARSNIMWCATWALNTLIAQGKSTDWEVHMLGQAVGAHTDATHGMTLSAVALPYYRLIMPYGVAKFARFAANVWGVDPAGKTEEELAAAGLDAMEAWMREIGCVMNTSELGMTRDMVEDVAKSVLVMQGGYHALSHDEIVEILRASLRDSILGDCLLLKATYDCVDDHKNEAREEQDNMQAIRIVEPEARLPEHAPSGGDEADERGPAEDVGEHGRARCIHRGADAVDQAARKQRDAENDMHGLLRLARVAGLFPIKTRAQVSREHNDDAYCSDQGRDDLDDEHGRHGA